METWDRLMKDRRLMVSIGKYNFQEAKRSADVRQLAKGHTDKQGSWRSRKVLTVKSTREERSHTLSLEYSQTGCLQQTLGDSG